MELRCSKPFSKITRELVLTNLLLLVRRNPERISRLGAADALEYAKKKIRRSCGMSLFIIFFL